MQRLKPYHLVLVAPPAWRSSMKQLACYVVAVDRAEVALEPLDAQDLQSLPVATPDVFLTFSQRDSLLALKGDLVLRSALHPSHEPGEDRADLRFYVNDCVRMPARHTLRLPLCAPVTLTPLGPEGQPGEPVHTQTIQVTGDGMYVEPPGPATPLSGLVDVALTLPGPDAPVRAVAAVGGREGEGLLLDFQRMSSGERDRLVTFIFECHRQALKMHKAEQRLRRPGGLQAGRRVTA